MAQVLYISGVKPLQGTPCAVCEDAPGVAVLSRGVSILCTGCSRVLVSIPASALHIFKHMRLGSGLTHTLCRREEGAAGLHPLRTAAAPLCLTPGMLC